jgi:hypothetical protein
MFVLSLLLSFLLGFTLVNRLLLLKSPGFSSLWWGKIFLSTGVGIGLSSVLYVSIQYIFQLAPLLVFFIELVFLSALLLYDKVFKKESYLPTIQHPLKEGKRMVEVFFFILLAISIGAFIYQSYLNPHGGWDAWAIWNMHARFISAGPQGWENLFSPHIYWTHPDYPLLIPGIIARNWGFIGSGTQMVPITIAFIFTFGTVGLLVAAVSFLKGRYISALAGIALLGTASFVQLGANQYADIPLGFFILSTLMLSLLYEKFKPGNKGILVLAGLSAGFAGWTKNEGLLFIMVFLATRFLVVAWHRNIKTCFREYLSLGKGLIPMGLVILYFNIKIAPGSDLFNDSWAHIPDKLTDAERYFTIIKGFVREFFLSGNGLVLVLMAFIFLAGVKLDKEIKIGVYTCLLVLMLMLVGYFLIYVITPKSLEWQLATSLERLSYQLVASMLLTVSMFLRPWYINEKGNNYVNRKDTGMDTINKNHKSCRMLQTCKSCDKIYI